MTIAIRRHTNKKIKRDTVAHDGYHRSVVPPFRSVVPPFRIPPDTVAHDQKKSPDRPGHDRYGGHRNDIVTRPAGAIPPYNDIILLYTNNKITNTTHYNTLILLYTNNKITK